MLLYACVQIIEMLKGVIWPANTYVEQVEHGEGGEKEVVTEEVQGEQPRKQYYLRERKPINYEED
jgi:hypothetical protein